MLCLLQLAIPVYDTGYSKDWVGRCGDCALFGRNAIAYVSCRITGLQIRLPPEWTNFVHNNNNNNNNNNKEKRKHAH